MTGWLDGNRRWLIAVLSAGYVASLIGLYVLMHSGFGERASQSDCWFGAWVVRWMNILDVFGLLLSVLIGAAISRLWRLRGIGWRIGTTIGITVVGVVVWWSFWWTWSFDPACGL